MSDYISELRRELVDAAERERRRTAPRRALARSRHMVVPAFAGLAVVVLAALVVAVLGREAPAPPPAGPRIVATIQLGGIPQTPLWARSRSGVTERRRPPAARRSDLQARDRDGAGRDRDEAACPRQPMPCRVMGAIDADTHAYRLIASIPPAIAWSRGSDRSSRFGAIDRWPRRDAVWMQLDKQAAGPLRRSIPRPTASRASVGRGGWRASSRRTRKVLWTLSFDGVLEWRDAASRAADSAARRDSPSLAARRRLGERDRARRRRRVGRDRSGRRDSRACPPTVASSCATVDSARTARSRSRAARSGSHAERCHRAQRAHRARRPRGAAA